MENKNHPVVLYNENSHGFIAFIVYYAHNISFTSLLDE